MSDDYFSPFIHDRIGFDGAFGYRFRQEDLDDISTKEFIMEQMIAEHWFEGVDH